MGIISYGGQSRATARTQSYQLREAPAFANIRSAIQTASDTEVEELAGDMGPAVQREAVREFTQRHLSVCVRYGIEAGMVAERGLGVLITEEASADLVRRINEDFSAWIDRAFPDDEMLEAA